MNNFVRLERANAMVDAVDGLDVRQNALPRPAPSEAPLMSPAMSVTSNFADLLRRLVQVTQPLESLIRTAHCASFGSIVQNGKFLGRRALLRQQIE